MAGNPRDRAAAPRTVLEQVLWEEEHTYEEIAAKFERVASELGEHTSITARHLRRLASGARSGTTPVTRRVLQAMFGQPVETLLSPWPASQPNPPPEAVEAHGSVECLSWSDHEALDGATHRARGFLMHLSTTNVNGETMDQLYGDVASLAVSYQRESPSIVVGRLIDLQAQVFDLLEGRQPPHHTRQLLLLAGVTSGLLGKISHDLADPHTAMTHTRTAYLCADNADHNGLRAWTRGLQSLIAYWAGRYNESIRYAQSGIQAGANNTSTVWLNLSAARAWAALGNPDEARHAIAQGESAREHVAIDEIDEIGGVCIFTQSRQLYYSADALTWLPTEAPQSESYAEAAVTAYADREATHWAFGDAAGSAADLAVARLQLGHIEGAAEALTPVLDLPASQRINGIVASVDRVYATLRSIPRSPAGSQLQEQIETFKARPLRALPSGH